MKLASMARSLKSIEDHQRQIAVDRLQFGLELERFLEEGGHEKLGYEHKWDYIEKEVCPRLGWSRAKVAKLLMASRELGNVLPFRRPGSGAPSVISLATLHTERRKQRRGVGRVAPREFRRMEKKVANGLSVRALGSMLGLVA